ncbi:MAG: hypothetical protein RJA07_2058 [Bacteroidota bacterium]|jgi:hypothetical protein
MKLKSLFLPAFILFFVSQSFAQSITINGFVSDSTSGERLIGAIIFDNISKEGTTTNNYGYYSLTIKSDKADLIINYLGYRGKQILVTGNGAHTLQIDISRSGMLKEVTIKSNRNQIQRESQMSSINIPIEQIKKIPALMGETDVLKVLQLLPGVSKGSEGGSGIYVRGGSPDQNLILLDGVPVYNVNHLFGFFSVFNGDAINNVQLIKGGFPARYGGRLSSVIDISMKDGNKNKIHGDGGIGLISSRLTLEGPIKNEKTTFLISARRTYLDLFMRPISYALTSGQGSTGYYFYDLNAKINHKFSDKDRLFLSSYIGKDNFGLTTSDAFNTSTSKVKAYIKWGNITTALRWNHLLSSKMFVNTTATFSQYKFAVGASNSQTNGTTTQNFNFDYTSGIQDVGLKTDFDYSPISKHHIKWGSNWTYHTFTPGINAIQSSNNGSVTTDTSFGSSKIYAHEAYLYAEDDWEITTRIKANVGLHASAFDVKNTFYKSLQPRISTRYLINEKTSIKASYSEMTQYMHLLSNTGIGLPTDLWVPATPSVKPQQSSQVALGIAHTYKNDFELSFETYYKSMWNVIEYQNGASFFGTAADWQNLVTKGKGNSYGGEFMVQKKYGRLTGWIGYTLSWSNRQFADKNNGVQYPYKYDQRHNIAIVASYELKKNIDVSGTWVYSSGTSLSLPTERYMALQQSFPNLASWSRGTSSVTSVENFQQINNFKMPSYHRLDVGINFHKHKSWGEKVYNISIYNAYNHLNAFFIYQGTDSVTGANQLKKLVLFPIIPSFSINFKF